MILTVLTAEIRVLFTANEAYMRDYNLIVPVKPAAAPYDNPSVSRPDWRGLGTPENFWRAGVRPGA